MFLARQSCGRSPKEIEMGCKVPITPACNNSDDITGHLRHFGHFSLTLLNAGLHKLWYPGIRDMSTWSNFGAHGEHGDVFLFSNLGAL